MTLKCTVSTKRLHSLLESPLSIQRKSGQAALSCSTVDLSALASQQLGKRENFERVGHCCLENEERISASLESEKTDGVMNEAREIGRAHV